MTYAQHKIVAKVFAYKSKTTTMIIKLYADSRAEAMNIAESKYGGIATRCYRDSDNPNALDRWVIYLNMGEIK